MSRDCKYEAKHNKHGDPGDKKEATSLSHVSIHAPSDCRRSSDERRDMGLVWDKSKLFQQDDGYAQLLTFLFPMTFAV